MSVKGRCFNIALIAISRLAADPAASAAKGCSVDGSMASIVFRTTGLPCSTGKPVHESIKQDGRRQKPGVSGVKWSGLERNFFERRTTLWSAEDLLPGSHPKIERQG